MALALALSVTFPSVARGHVFLQSADPSEGSIITYAPERVTLTFTSEVARGTRITVLDEAGNDQTTGPTDRDGIRASVALAPLWFGVYTVQWTAVSLEDGHESTGSFQFTIGLPSEG